MADVLTNTSGNWSSLVQTAFDRAVGWYLNDEVWFRSVVDKKPVAQAMPGATVTLTIQGQLPPNSTPLTEGVDPDAVQMVAPRQLSVTLQEYGNVVKYTNKLNKVAFTGTVVQDISREIATNLVESVDLVYKAALDGATNKLYTDTTATTTGGVVAAPPGTATNAGPITAQSVAAAVSLLRRRKAEKRDGANYVAYIHPDVSYDLRTATAANSWQNPHIYEDTANIYAGEIGTFQGAKFIESTRCTIVAGTPNTYNTYLLGREGLVELVGEEPHVVVGPQVDKLRRDYPVGWYGLLGVSRYRENALQILRTTSTINGLAGAYDPKA